MEVPRSPDVQDELDRLSKDTIRPAARLIEDARAGYFDERNGLRKMLERRLDELKSGQVRPASGEEARASLRGRSARHRAGRNGQL